MKKKIVATMLALVMAMLLMPANLLQVEAAKKPIKAKSITLNRTNYTLKKGKKVKLKASVLPSNATQKKVQWSSSKKKVATVNSKGVVKAKKNGKTTITAKVKGTKLKAKCKIVVGTPVKKVTLSKTSQSLNVGGSIQLSATVTPKKASNTKVTYTTSNKAVAVVDMNGKVTAKAAGTATITATSKDGTERKAACKIKVVKPIVEDTSNDLRVLSVASTDNSVKKYSITDDGVIIVYTLPQVSVEELGEKLIFTLSQKNARWELSLGKHTDYLLELTGADGERKRYEVLCRYDYDEYYQDLRVKSVTSTDGTIINYDIDSYKINIYGVAEGIGDIVGLQFVLGSATAVWKLENDCLTLIGTDGTSRTYDVYYHVDYNTLYGDLYVKSVSSTDEAITDYYIDESHIEIYGKTTSLDEISGLSFDIAEGNAEWKLDYNDCDEHGVCWTLTLSGRNGKTRTYSVYYEVDYEAIGFCVESVSSSVEGIVTEYWIGYNSIDIYGTAESIEEAREYVCFQFGRDVITYEWTEIYDEYRAGLVITNEEGVTRTYTVFYNY